MFGKNGNKKVGLCVMVVTACLVLATLWAVLATPETTLAGKPEKPPKDEEDTYTLEYNDASYKTSFNLVGLEGTLSGGGSTMNVRFVESDLSDLVESFGTSGDRYKNYLQILSKDSINAMFQFWFLNEATSIPYVLRMPGTISGNWPPDADETTTVTGLGDWEISLTAGKYKKLDVYQGGSGSGLDWTLTITKD